MNQRPPDPSPPFPDRRTRARGVAAAVILGLLGLALAKDAARTTFLLGRLAGTRILEWHTYERALGAADTGREKLPAGVTRTVAALKANGGPAFRLSPGMTQDMLLRQRISEVAWPLPIDPAAALLVRLASEPSSCAPLALNDGVAVDRCD